MHVVQVAGFYGPTSGGLRTAVDALGAGYLASGLRRTLVVPGDRDGEEETPSGRCVTLAGPTLPGGAGYRIFADRRRLASVVASLEPDRIEVSDKLHAALLGRVANDLGVRALLVSHERLDGILAARVPRVVPLRRLADAWNRRYAHLYPTVVCASTWAAAELRRVGANVVRIPLGVDLDTFAPGAAGRVDDGRIRLVCVSRLSAEKRPALAVETLAHLLAVGIPASLTMVGAGPLEDGLRRAARGLPVTFTGHVADRSALAALLAAADVALAPCPVETFGLAVLEAMACGTPVVVAEGGGAPELVADRTGRVARTDPASFAHAVLVLASDDTARRAARRHADAHSWARATAAFLAAHDIRVPMPA